VLFKGCLRIFLNRGNATERDQPAWGRILFNCASQRTTLVLPPWPDATLLLEDELLVAPVTLVLLSRAQATLLPDLLFAGAATLSETVQFVTLVLLSGRPVTLIFDFWPVAMLSAVVWLKATLLAVPLTFAAPVGAAAAAAALLAAIVAAWVRVMRTEPGFRLLGMPGGQAVIAAPFWQSTVA
jgi:hypothetical protein